MLLGPLHVECYQIFFIDTLPVKVTAPFSLLKSNKTFTRTSTTMAKQSLIHLIPRQQAKLDAATVAATTSNERSNPEESSTHQPQNFWKSSSSGGGGVTNDHSTNVSNEGLEVIRASTTISATSHSSSIDTVSTGRTPTSSASSRSLQLQEKVATALTSETKSKVAIRVGAIENGIEISRQRSYSSNSTSPSQTTSKSPYPKKKSVQEKEKVSAGVAMMQEVLPVVIRKELVELVSPSKSVPEAENKTTLKPIFGKNTRNWRIDGIFAISLPLVQGKRGFNNPSLSTVEEVETKRTSGGKLTFKQDDSQWNIEIVQGDETSVCTESIHSYVAPLSSDLPAAASNHAPTAQTQPLTKSFDSLIQTRSRLINKVSVAQSNEEAIEVVSGELVSNTLTSPSEAISRRTSSKISISTFHHLLPFELGLVSSQEVEDAFDLVTLKKAAPNKDSTCNKGACGEKIENPYEEETMEAIRRIEGNIESSIATTQCSNVEDENMHDTIELHRNGAVEPTSNAGLSDCSFDETEEQLEITVKPKNDNMNEIGTSTMSNAVSWHDEHFSVHTRALTVPITKLPKDAAREGATKGTFQVLRSKSVLKLTDSAKDDATTKTLISSTAMDGKPLRASIQNQEEVIELVRHSSSGTTLHSTASVDSCDSTCNGSAGSKTVLPVKVDLYAGRGIEVRRPGSFSSLFSRNAPVYGPNLEDKSICQPVSIIGVDDLQDTIELQRSANIQHSNSTPSSVSFGETEEQLWITVEPKNDNTIELLRTETSTFSSTGSRHDEISSVDSITTPTIRAPHVLIREESTNGTIEILPSNGVIKSTKDSPEDTEISEVEMASMGIDGLYNQKDAIELVCDHSTGACHETGRTIQLPLAVDSWDTECDGSTRSNEALPVIKDSDVGHSIEVRHPGSFSSVFSRNAPADGPKVLKSTPESKRLVDRDFVIVSSSSYMQSPSVGTGASSAPSVDPTNNIPVEAPEVTSLRPTETHSVTSIGVGTHDSNRPHDRSSAIEDTETISAIDQGDSSLLPSQIVSPAISNQDALVSRVPARDSRSIPKLPAPTNDTAPMHVAEPMLQKGFLSASRRKLQLRRAKSDKKKSGNTSDSASEEFKVVTRDRKEVAPKAEFTDHFLCTPEHMVHVNVLGVAGIVVNKKACQNTTGNNHLPPPPDRMRMVVGIAERGSDKMSSVTTFSKSLIPSPNGEVGKGKHRHVAVWASNNEGLTPGSLISSDPLTLDRVTYGNPKSRYKPKFFDLTVALAKDSKPEENFAIPIGVANLKVNGDFVSHGEMVTMDLPVYSVQQVQETKNLTNPEGISSSEAPFIKLKKIDTRRDGGKGIFQRKSAHRDSVFPTQEERSALSLVYSIDPTGDSMIRVQVRVETLGVEKRMEPLDSPMRGGEENRLDEPCDRTAATDPTENDSVVTSQENSTDANRESDIEGETSDKKPVCVLESNSTEALYSPPLELPTGENVISHKPVAENSSEISSQDKDSGLNFQVFGNSLALPTCGPIQDPTMAAKRLDDEIELVAQKVFGHTIPFSNVTSKTGSDESVHDLTQDEEDSSLARDGSLYASLSGMSANFPSEMDFDPALTMDEIGEYVRKQFGNFALKSGEFFFPEDPNLLNDDSSSVGDATLEAFMSGKLRMRSIDNRTWRKYSRDDDSRTYSSEESEPTISLQPFGKSSERQRKVPMATVEEGKPMDPPTNEGADGDQLQTPERPRDDEDNDIDPMVEEADNDGDDEMSYGSPPKRSSSRRYPGSVAESMVQSLAEAFATYYVCGAYSSPKKQPMKVPTTLEPELLSVGDLTAVTWEQHQQKNKSTKGGFPTAPMSMFLPFRKAGSSGWFACVSNSDYVDDKVASTPIQFTRSDSQILGVTQTNSVLTTTDIDEENSNIGNTDTTLLSPHRRENYFAEYEDGGHSNLFMEDQSHSMSSSRNGCSVSTPRAAGATIASLENRRVGPPADPPASRLADDEQSNLMGGASTVFSSTSLGGKSLQKSTLKASSIQTAGQSQVLFSETESEEDTIFHEDDEC